MGVIDTGCLSHAYKVELKEDDVYADPSASTTPTGCPAPPPCLQPGRLEVLYSFCVGRVLHVFSLSLESLLFEIFSTAKWTPSSKQRFCCFSASFLWTHSGLAIRW